MKFLLGLAVTAVTLTGCGSSSAEFTTNLPQTPETPADEPDVAETPVTTPVVVEIPSNLVSTPVDNDPAAIPNSPPVVSGTPNAPNAPVGSTSSAIALGNVTSASFDGDAGTLTVQIALDGNDDLQQYIAVGTLDGYSRFAIQDDPLDRQFVAFARESDDGLLQAVVVSDGGQFNRAFAGGAITQNAFTAPASGLASYAGDYVGLTNLGPSLVTGNGADPAIVPEATTDVTGNVFINVDFASSQMNGAIFDRVYDPTGAAIDLQDIVLAVTDIEGNGQFNGSVEFDDFEEVGTYSGALGGNQATSIAGIVSLSEGFLDEATFGGNPVTVFDDVEGEIESGVFVSEQCSAGGAGCLDSN